MYIFSADATANHPFLHHLAMTAGGRYFNLAQLRDAEVVPVIGRAAFSFLSASSDSGQAAGIYPELPQPVAGRFTVAGKLTGQQATVTLSYGFPGNPLQKRSFKVSRSQAAEGSLLRRLWAQKKLADLMVFQERNEKEIVALGKQFGMVTPFTSLIVLENLEQYVEHEIAPPKSLAAMREEYMRRIDTLEFQKKKQKADKIESVLKMWDERVKWWKSEFKYPADFRYKEPADKAKDGAGVPASLLPRQSGTAASGRTGHAAGRPADGTRGAAGVGGGPGPARLPDGGARVPAEAAPARAGEPPVMFGGGRFGPSGPSPARGSASGPSVTNPAAQQPGILIKPWDPETPYLKELRAAKGKDLLAVYMANRAKYGNSPAFFLDCADFFLQEKDGAGPPGPQQHRRAGTGGRRGAADPRLPAREAGYLDLAIQTFEQVLELRPEEPQSYRDLALTLAQRAGQKKDSAPRRLRPGHRSLDPRGDAPLGRAVPGDRGHRPGGAQRHPPPREGGRRDQDRPRPAAAFRSSSTWTCGSS